MMSEQVSLLNLACWRPDRVTQITRSLLYGSSPSEFINKAINGFFSKKGIVVLSRLCDSKDSVAGEFKIASSYASKTLQEFSKIVLSVSLIACLSRQEVHLLSCCSDCCISR